MYKVLALNDKGQTTYCRVPPHERGKGRCNHIAHQNDGETPEEFANRISEEFGYGENFKKDIQEKEAEIAQYKMTEDEKLLLDNIKGKKHLEDENCQGGYIELENPLWNDVDKDCFANVLGTSKSKINSVIQKNSHIVIKTNIPRVKLGGIYTLERAQKIKDTFGDEVEFDTGVSGLNRCAEMHNFEATKDIYVLPYYMRQDPPDSTGKNPLNVHYNAVILNRKNIDKQQASYERLLNNKNALDPLKAKGYALRSLSDEFVGKSGLLRGYMSGKTISHSGRAVVSTDSTLEYDQIAIPPGMAIKLFKPTFIDMLRQDGKSNEEIAEFFSKFEGKQHKIKTSDLDQLENMLFISERRVIADRQPSLHHSSFLSFRPRLSRKTKMNIGVQKHNGDYLDVIDKTTQKKGEIYSLDGFEDTVADDTIHFSPMVVKGYNMDFDGDTSTIFAINDALVSRKTEKNTKHGDKKNLGMSSEDTFGTTLPRHEKTRINNISNEAMFGLMNLLSRRK